MNTHRFVLAGGSHGGAVALQYAITYPQRVQALILRGTFANGALMYPNAIEWTQSSPWLLVKPDPSRQQRLWSGQLQSDLDYVLAISEIANGFAAHPPSITASSEVDESPVDPSSFCAEAANGGLGPDLHSWNVIENLPILEKIPSFVAVGRHDLVAPVSFSEAIAKGIGASCDVHIFEYSGHSPAEEEHERWEEVLSTWMDKVITNMN